MYCIIICPLAVCMHNGLICYCKYILNRRCVTCSSGYTYNSHTLTCYQVCWYWKYLAEANEIWLVKCLRRGWFLPTPPSPFDQAAWKRHYVCCVSQLHWNPPQVNVLQYCRTGFRSIASVELGGFFVTMQLSNDYHRVYNIIYM